MLGNYESDQSTLRRARGSPGGAGDLPANTPVSVLIPEAGDTEQVGKLFAKLSEPSFKRIWDNEEDAAYDKL